MFVLSSHIRLPSPRFALVYCIVTSWPNFLVCVSVNSAPYIYAAILIAFVSNKMFSHHIVHAVQADHVAVLIVVLSLESSTRCYLHLALFRLASLKVCHSNDVATNRACRSHFFSLRKHARGSWRPFFASKLEGRFKFRSLTMLNKYTRLPQLCSV